MRRRPRALLPALLALLLAACAPAVQGPGPLQGSARLEVGAFHAEDGTRLPLRSWLPAPERPVAAAVVALHGFNDYGRAFAQPAAWWAERAIATYAIDQRGFGEAPEPGIWGGAEAMAADARALVREVRRRHPGVPVHLLGDSMGGAVALLALTGPVPAPADGAILVAPAVWGGETMPAAYRWGIWLAAHTMPWNRATGGSLRRQPSDNLEMLRALGRDPLVIKYTRLDTVYWLTRLMDEALAAAPGIGVPVLVLHGAKDEIVPASAVERLVDRLPGPKRRARYPDGWHMLLRDLGAVAVWQDIAAWLADSASALPSGAEVKPGRGTRNDLADK